MQKLVHYSWTVDRHDKSYMKSQDVVVLFKLISLELRAEGERVKKREFAVMHDLEAAIANTIPDREMGSSYLQEFRPFEKVVLSGSHEWEGWEDWEDSDEASIAVNAESYSVRALSAALGLSKSEISNSLNRCKDIGLVHTDRQNGLPIVRSEALLDLVKYSIRYIFPAKPGPIVRGIPTAFAAPIMEGKVMSAGDLIPVWPDAYGKRKGQEVVPLFKTVPGAVKKDELLYHFLALVDAIRIGNPREAKVADSMLREWIL
jgi:DNA-binding transcriptional ArsR family regulator